MHICVIGSGIAGLSAAHRLAARPDTEVTVLEAASVLGGRARVTDGAEHCTRFFMEDYSSVLRLLREVPSGAGSVADSVLPVRRFVWVPAGRWVEISHAYVSRSRELSLHERWVTMREGRTSLLIARRSADNANLLGTGTDYSLRSIASIARKIYTARSACMLPGCTDTFLIDPWVRHLTDRGVSVRVDSRVERIAVGPDGVDVVLASRAERYDAVIVTAFVHGAYDLLDRSGIARHLDRRRHVHCRCFTIDLDPREPVLQNGSLRSYSITGLTVVVQPAAARCIALTTTLASTAEDHVLDLVRQRLPLAFAPKRVRVRDNQDPGDGVFAGEHVDPISLDDAAAATAGGARRVFFAGSYTKNGYGGIDSAEAACRSALHAVERLEANCNGQARTQPARAASGKGVPRHPNAIEHPRTAAAAWRLACIAAHVCALQTARVSLVDLSGLRWPLLRPAIFVANTPSTFDIAGLLTFHRLQVRPRLVVAEHRFDGLPGRALDTVGALPALSSPGATRAAASAAILAGESVAFGIGGLDDAREADAIAVAKTTGAPIVPIAISGAPGRRRTRTKGSGRPLRPEVVVVVGLPVPASETDAAELGARVRWSLEQLTAATYPRDEQAAQPLETVP